MIHQNFGEAYFDKTGRKNYAARNFQCTVSGCSETVKTKNALTRHSGLPLVFARKTVLRDAFNPTQVVEKEKNS